jgi:molybdopterin-guanine dinucleotide biosynthesis protein A
LGLWSARADYDAVVPVWRGSRQPLCAVYSKNCLEPMARLSRSPERGIRDLFDVVRTRFYLEAEAAADDPAGLSFSDLDSRREYEEALRLAGG